MVSGNWTDGDGLYRLYGTSKATAATAGEYRMPGADRVTEVDIDVSLLTTTALIIDNKTYIPAGVTVDKVDVIATTGAATITSLSVGLMKHDRTTTISDTALVAAIVLASIDGTGETTALTNGSTYAGTKIGTTVGTDPGYITAKIAGSAGTGMIKVRIFWRGTTPITQ